MRIKKIFLTGSNGLLGQKLVIALESRPDVELVATSRGENRAAGRKGYAYESLDVLNFEAVKDALARHRPDTLIHTAAMTNVDLCEGEKDLCWRLNVDTVGMLSLLCQRYDIHLIHLSTDFIFNGRKGSFYRETDAPCPLSYYGKSKLVSEELVLERKMRHTIIRTILLYGVVGDLHRSNIVLWAKEALGKRTPINVVSDQYRSPTLAEDLADACIQSALREALGIYHVSGKDFMSILELVETTADFFGLDRTLIRSVDSKTLKQAAVRPAKTGFVLDRAMRDLDYQPHSFKEGLGIIKAQLEERQAAGRR